MAQPYVGEIRIFAGNFAPAGWMFCEGQLLPISENETLFNLIGTTYGGDGQSTFALPDLRGRIPLHFGNGFIAGRDWRRGDSHAHRAADPLAHSTRSLRAPTTPRRRTRRTTSLGDDAELHAVHRHGTPNTAVNLQPIASTGGSQPHNNFQPYLCVDFIISLFGIFPSQN